MDVTGDPKIFGIEGDSASLNFHVDRITIQPSEYVGNVDCSSKFIDDNRFLISVTVPPFGARALSISRWSGLFPGPSRLTSPSRPPKDFASPLNRKRDLMVCSNCLERAVIANVNIRGNVIKLIVDGKLFNRVPVI